MNKESVTALLKTIRVSSQVTLVILFCCVFLVIAARISDWFFNSNLVATTFNVAVGIFVIATLYASLYVAHLINSNKDKVLNMAEQSERYRVLMETLTSMPYKETRTIFLQLVRSSARSVLHVEEKLNKARLAIQEVCPSSQSVSYHDETLRHATKSIEDFKEIHCLVSNHFDLPKGVAECANLLPDEEPRGSKNVEQDELPAK